MKEDPMKEPTMLRHNPILDTDSYKASHYRQYPPGTEKLFGYLESRGGRYAETVFFGLQYFLRRYLSQPITAADIDEAAAYLAQHGEPFPEAGWRHILDQHGGLVPVRIRAVPEGTAVPVRNVLATVESTDPRVPWVVGWIETQLMRLWYPITVCTRSYVCKKVIFEYLQKTAEDPLGELPFKLHDFGGRGVSSAESAGIGGAAHLVNFLGSDTIEGGRYAKAFYGSDKPMLAFSIPAMEHATVTAWGREGEASAYRNMIAANPEYATLACVSDSYDIDRAVEQLWADELLDEVKASGKTIVIRPDSGDPVEVNLRLLQILERKVGMTVNGKGYKVLPRFFRLIQGDGNDSEEDLARILLALEQHGYSASNIAFGMGGGLLQKLDRDTQRFAFKLSEIVVAGQRRSVAKDPKTDPGKRSKAGRLDLVKREGVFTTVAIADPALAQLPASEMVTVYEDGRLMAGSSFDEVRARAARAFT
jgi:nicotinamide phosphoribosyltransferase